MPVTSFSFFFFFLILWGNTFLHQDAGLPAGNPLSQVTSISIRLDSSIPVVTRSFFFLLVLLNVVNTLKDENVLELHMHLKKEGVLVQIIAESSFLPFFLCRGRELRNTAIQAKTNSI